MTIDDLIKSGVTRALSLWPEWPYAIVHLDKDLECRGSDIPRTMRGQRFALHAGAHVGGRPGKNARLDGLAALIGTAAESAGWQVTPGRGFVVLAKGDKVVKLDPNKDIVISAIVATVVVRETIRPMDKPKRPWHVPGQWGWVLEDMQVLATPIPCGGMQGFWPLSRLPEPLPGAA